MSNVHQQFIDHKIHTVPLGNGEITRQADVKQTKTGFVQPLGWNNLNITFNTTATAVASVVCGKTSGMSVMVIDCDCQEKFDEFKALDPNYNLHFVSVGKKKGGGSIIYLYNDKVKSFKYHDINLELLSDGTNAFLPTESNRTKQPWDDESLSDLKEMPNDVLNTLKVYKAKYVASKATINIKTWTAGSGRNDYIFKQACNLVEKPNMTEQHAYDSISAINQQFATPLDNKELTTTLNSAFKKCQVSITNTGLTFKAKDGENTEIIIDKVSRDFYFIQHDSQLYLPFKSQLKCLDAIKSAGYLKCTKKVLEQQAPIMTVDCNPARDFGVTAGGFNTFIQSPALKVLNNPTSHIYKKPTTTLAFLESFVPDKTSREYLLKFLKRKLTTFDYSPVVLYFVGVQGSGKDIFTELLSKLAKVTSPDFNTFLGDFNPWLDNTHFVQLDEFAEKATTTKARRSIYSNIKKYTGEKTHDINKKFAQPIASKNRATFVVTSNAHFLPMDLDDRRVMFIDTPNKLVNNQWVTSPIATYTEILDEAKDFAYYLATKVSSMTDSEYIEPPMTPNKMSRIEDTLSPKDDILNLFRQSRFADLANMAQEEGVEDFTEGWINGRLLETMLFTLVDKVCSKTLNKRAFTKELKKAGFTKKRTMDGLGYYFYYYSIPSLSDCLPLTPSQQETLGDFGSLALVK